jgi:hypothetical protein
LDFYDVQQVDLHSCQPGEVHASIDCGISSEKSVTTSALLTSSSFGLLDAGAGLRVREFWISHKYPFAFYL